LICRPVTWMRRLELDMWAWHGHGCFGFDGLGEREGCCGGRKSDKKGLRGRGEEDERSGISRVGGDRVG
jgi:hypothetical protein